MQDNSLISILPDRLEKAVQEVLQPGEAVHVKLKGAFKEALVCTDRRVIIVKTGFMTGHLFGNNVFQLPYEQIASVEVTYKMLTGYFEVSAGGVQNAERNYWAKEKAAQPQRAPNCVSITGPDMAAAFREACNFILGRRPAGAADAPIAPIAAIAQLAALRDQGLVSGAEFEAKRRELLARI